MISILNKILKKKNNLNFVKSNLKELEDKTNISIIFNSINNFSEESEVRFVGGCIRKILNNEDIDDIDLATNLKPDQVCEVLSKNKVQFYESGIEHGTITAKINNIKFEITSLRKDIITDGRHAKVEFSKNWYDDASRRDFTINSIYSDFEGNIYDPFNGKKDLENGCIKFIGKEENRIKEDYLRILRYIRFFLNYSKKDHSENTKKIIRKNIEGIAKISPERLLDELKKIVLSKNFFNINKDDFLVNILKLIFPQLININIFNNLNENQKKILKNKDFFFFISLMIINETDNSDYFLYKFNIPNDQKKRIKFLKNFYIKNQKKSIFTEDQLWQILYENNKILLNDIIDFNIIKNKNSFKKLIKLKEFFENKEAPKLHINAKYIMQKFNIKEGPYLGQILKNIERYWIENKFKISDEKINEILKN
tara:strand:- start:13031 stop:14305 length:1275 start_codon:yes stop_codon:yes gene_type:complete